MSKLYECPACGTAGFSSQALRVHICRALGRRQLRLDEWKAALRIEEIKRDMLRSATRRSNMRLRVLQRELERLAALFPKQEGAEV